MKTSILQHTRQTKGISLHIDYTTLCSFCRYGLALADACKTDPISYKCLECQKGAGSFGH